MTRIIQKCRFQIGDEVSVNLNEHRPWTADWQEPNETWFVAGIKVAIHGGFDIWLIDRPDWERGACSGGADGFDDVDLSLVQRAQVPS